MLIFSTNYNDSTPDVAMNYDPFGRPVTQTNGQATSTFAYDPATLALDTETISYDLNSDGTPELTRVIDRSRDNLLRDIGFQLKKAAVVENSVTYGYHATEGRLENVANLSTSFTYGYEPNSYGLIKTVTSPIHTVTNTYKANRDILTSKQNVAGAFTRSGYTYGVNEIGQRTDLTTTFDLGGNLSSNPGDTDWGYNSKGEVTKADHTIPGLDRAYVFDSIGNRLKTAEGTTNSNDPSAINYTPNALNQYTAIGALNPVHDDDGNMTSGSLPANVNANSTLVWDGENRLIQAQVTGGGTATYLYDSQSRRIATISGAVTSLTIYDGWNPIAEYSISNNQYSISQSFTWGMDLSGTMQGAGGVGGLLAVTDSTGTYFPTYDGNGNVSEYLDSIGNVSAHYEYDPFGKTTVATGSKANDFSHRFSTKPIDATTGLYYYGYRFYDPNTGRWPSRDPIQERGGVNLYGFVKNSALNFVDKLGLATTYPFPPEFGGDPNELPWSSLVAIEQAVDGDVTDGSKKMTSKIALSIVNSLPSIPLPGGDDSLQDVIRAGEAALKKAADEASMTQKLCVGAVSLTAEFLIFGKTGTDFSFPVGSGKVMLKGTINKSGVIYGEVEFTMEF